MTPEGRNCGLVVGLLPVEDDAEDRGLPGKRTNIFHRLIRNPRRPDRPMRERRCTEMLCAVLQNALILRSRIMEWMARIGQFPHQPLVGLEWMLQTEVTIRGGKRLDLLIKAFDPEDEQEVPKIVWPVEVKVSAGLHWSTALDDGHGEPSDDEDDDRPTDDEEEETEWVSQLENYDRWLSLQEADAHRHGFVLAIPDVSAVLPPLSLQCHWKCLTWTGLGRVLEEALADPELPRDERILGRHMLGFMQTHLWRNRRMLNANDLALLRAYDSFGMECKKKVQRLVEPLKDLFSKQGIGHGELSLQKNQLFRTHRRTVVYRQLFAGSDSEIYAGIAKGSIWLWIETPPGSTQKNTIGAVAKDKIGALQENDARWKLRIHDSRYWDVGIEIQLEHLIIVTETDESEDAQIKRLQDLISNGLKHLKQVGFAQAVQERLGADSGPSANG